MTREQQSHYDECIANGCAPSLAEMLALRQFPYSKTDREFLAGLPAAKRFEQDQRAGNLRKKVAESLGASTNGAVYLGQLAKFPGDPEAWVSGRGDVKRVLEKRGWSSEGMVEHKEPLRDIPEKPYMLADDLVRDYTQQELAKDPGKNPEKVKEDVINKHLPNWAK